MRNLAARSASAAKETTELIDNSMRKVDAGTKIADETAESLGSIVGTVEETAALVEQIADASKEQSHSIEQIKMTLSQVSAVVQTNSASAQEGAASSEELAAQANLMKGQVARFKLKGAGATLNLSQHEAAQAIPTGRRREPVQISLVDDDKY